MWLGKDPSRVQADPCPRIRARVSCSRLSPQRLGVLQRPLPLTPRPRDERSKPLFPPPPPHLLTETPHLTALPGMAAGPRRLPPPLRYRRVPFPGAAPLPPLTAVGGCPLPARTFSLLDTPEKRTLPPPPPAPSRAAPLPPRARRPLPERRRQQGLRAARPLMAAYPTRGQPPAPQQPGEGLPRRCGKRGGPM